MSLKSGTAGLSCLLLCLFFSPALAQKGRPKDNAIKQYNRGIELNSQGRVQEAIEAYKQAIRISPDFPEPYINLANVYGKLGNYQEAVVNPDSRSAEALSDLGMGYGSAGQWQEALDPFKKAVTLKPGLAQAHYGLAVAYLNLGNRAAATEEYEILKRLDSNLASKLSQAIQQ